MKPRDQTLATVQRNQRVDAALKAQLKVQIVSVANVLPENRQRKIVTRAHAQDLMPFVTRNGEDLREIGAQRFDMWLEAHAHPALRP
jgi:hypothetical protein